MKARKLLTRSTLEELKVLTDLGVPVATAMRKTNVDLTRPTVVRLLEAYRNIDKWQSAEASLFPPWLIEDCQEQPDDYSYIGFFPRGFWECKT